LVVAAEVCFCNPNMHFMNIECCKKHLRFINPNGAMIYCSFFWLFSPCANIDCKSSDWRILFLWSVCCFLMLQYKWCDWASFCHIAYSTVLLDSKWFRWCTALKLGFMWLAGPYSNIPLANKFNWHCVVQVAAYTG
jgi:hypothetical protein